MGITKFGSLPHTWLCLLFSNNSLATAFQAGEVIARNNTLALAVGTCFNRLIDTHHAFATTDHAGKALVSMNASAATVSALDGRFIDGNLSPATTDLTGGDFREKFKRIGSLSLTEGTLKGNISFFLSHNLHTHYICLHYLVTTMREGFQLQT